MFISTHHLIHTHGDTAIYINMHTYLLHILQSFSNSTAQIHQENNKEQKEQQRTNNNNDDDATIGNQE